MYTYAQISNFEQVLDTYSTSNINNLLNSLSPNQLIQYHFYWLDETNQTKTKILIFFQTSIPIQNQNILSIQLNSQLIHIDENKIINCSVEMMIGLNKINSCRFYQNLSEIQIEIGASLEINFAVALLISGMTNSQLDNFSKFRTQSQYIRILDQNQKDIMKSTQGSELFTLYSKEFLQNSSTTKCSETCKNCKQENSTQCLNCFVPSEHPFFYNYECISHCPQATFRNIEYPYCFPCFSACLSCFGGGANECLECQNGYNFDSGFCFKECKVSCQNKNGICIYQESKSCQDECILCGSDLNYCVSCQSNNEYSTQSRKFDPILHQCYNENLVCRTGVLFFTSGELRCNICNEICNTCEYSSTQCTVCSEFFGRPYLNQELKVCVEVCPSSTYQFGTTCISCDKSCLTCEGADENSCLSCEKSQFLDYYSCVDQCLPDQIVDGNNCWDVCTNSRCYRCEGSDKSNCTKCNGNQPILYNGNCLAGNECPNGTFYSELLQEQFCLNCSNLCKECNLSATNCTLCYTDTNATNKFFYENQCLKECPSGYSPDYYDNLTCKQFNCTEPCKTCGHNATICASCYSNLIYKYFYSDSFQCLQKCPDSTYQNEETFTCIEISAQQSDNLVHMNSVLEVLKNPFILSIVLQIVIALVWIGTSSLIIKNQVSYHSSLLALLTPIEFISKLFICIESIKMQLIGGLFSTILSICMNSVIAVIFKILDLEIAEIQNNPIVKDYQMNNSKFYKMIKWCMLLVGPNLFKIFSSRLALAPKNYLNAENQLRLNSNKMMTYSFLLSFLLIGLDLYCLIQLESSILLFHLSYLNLGINGMLTVAYFKEELDSWKLFSYTKMKDLKE